MISRPTFHHYPHHRCEDCAALAVERWHYDGQRMPDLYLCDRCAETRRAALDREPRETPPASETPT
jgi:hypothetical protein